MTKISWNRRVVLAAASAALIGGGVALPAAAMAVPAAPQNGIALAPQTDPEDILDWIDQSVSDPTGGLGPPELIPEPLDHEGWGDGEGGHGRLLDLPGFSEDGHSNDDGDDRPLGGGQWIDQSVSLDGPTISDGEDGEDGGMGH
ncbi:hypothetical protein [Streptomyces sp. NPDC048603]|uniref:hypothetical protein n=1 Tax=Streptomyces sp. NPDC048603 TaxID=3365577 RepID=UPI003711C05F